MDESDAEIEIEAEPEPESNYEQRISRVRNTEDIDAKFGYTRYTGFEPRRAWLFNFEPAEIIDEETKVLTSVCDFYFIEKSGDRFKISYPYRPYIYLATLPSFEFQVSSYISKKYSGTGLVDVVEKEDLDLKNHLSGLKRKFLRISFSNVGELVKFKKDMMPILRRNQEREKSTSSYTTLLARHFAGSESSQITDNPLEKIIDIREFDVPYHVRVCIDLKLFVGFWYDVIGMDADRMPSMKRLELAAPPDLTILAYDIEVTKLPLKFPDSCIDEIMMISYMLNGDGYLIVNRHIVLEDVEDFEYTPRPEYKGLFKVSNAENEEAVLRTFFEHIKQTRPSIISTYNGDSFDWPFVEARALLHGIDMKREIGFYRSNSGDYKSTHAVHMDAFRWVKRDSYLPMGSQSLKACTKAKLRYDPVELNPELMCTMAREQPQVLASYSVSDAVATYYLYVKYVHPFIFALCTIIPMGSEDVLRKGSGTLCEALLMVEAYHSNIIFPNKKMFLGNKITKDGHMIDSETYVGGHVEALESGLFRFDIPVRFRMVPTTICDLIMNLEETFKNSLETEANVDIANVVNFDEVCDKVKTSLRDFINRPMRLENPRIYHLDVAAMYPNIILTNRLQPPAMVTEEECIACIYNTPDAQCKRAMSWEWRGEIMPATRGEYDRILQQLEGENFGKPAKPYHSLNQEERTRIEQQRMKDYCKRAYGKTHVTRTEERLATVCQRENAFYVNTVRAFRDRRYEYKNLLKKAKSSIREMRMDDVLEVKRAQGQIVLYESLQLAHKCILNSFYGYVMRKGSRWFSMEMAGIVCHTGAHIIREARKLIERIGKALELDTDGIWCLLPASFPENITFKLENAKTVTISFPGSVLNNMVRRMFTNEQYHDLQPDGSYKISSQNSIFFEVDGPYLAMFLPASKEEGKKLKKRSLAELKGFEIKRRGELAIVKHFQSNVFKAFLSGKDLEGAYKSAASEANHWLDILFSKGENLTDMELFDLVSENRSMSKKLEEYGAQKSTSISTAKRLAEFLGADMVKDAGLACKFIISRHPIGSPVTERAVPVAIFQASSSVCANFLRKWTKNATISEDNMDPRNIIDWDYYVERFGGAVQKIIVIPAALQNVSNPVKRIAYPDWLEHRRRELTSDCKQKKITEMFSVQNIPKVTGAEAISKQLIPDTDLENEDYFEVTRNEKSSPVKIAKKRIRFPTEELSLCPVRKKIPKKSIQEDGVKEWIRYLKQKWRMERESAKNAKSVPRIKHDSVYSFIREQNQSVLQSVWQVIRVADTGEKGVLRLWVIVNDKMRIIKLVVPRIFYVNDHSKQEGAAPVKRILPRMKPSYNLYRYSVSQEQFENSAEDWNQQLCAMRIEGIYESQVPVKFRALVHMSNCCRLKSSNDRMDMTNVNLEDLEMVDDFQYLGDDSTRCLFYYDHYQDTHSILAIFNVFQNEAFIAFISKKASDIPNAGNIFAAERDLLQNEQVKELFLDRPNMKFVIQQYTSSESANLNLNKYLKRTYQFEKSPTIIAVISSQTWLQLSKSIPMFNDFPFVRLKVYEPSGLLNVLDWRRFIIKRAVNHFFNVFEYLEEYAQISRYLRIPIGNIPVDISLFACDLIYSRSLLKQGYVLWTSPTSLPDLGGKELDDGRIGPDWQSLSARSQPHSIINTECFETDVCVQLELGAVALTALIQGSRIIQAEGGAQSIGFTSGNALANEYLLGRVKNIAHYDEGAALSGAMKILRGMFQECLKDIFNKKIQVADHLIVNLDRWIRSPRSLLYDPALSRVLDVSITKLCLLLVAEIKRLGGRTIFASSSHFVISTEQKNIKRAKGFVESLIHSLQQNLLFASLSITPVNYWSVLMWMDARNYVGVALDEATNKPKTFVELAMAKILPEEKNCQNSFIEMIVGYCALVFHEVISQEDSDLCAFRLSLIKNELTPNLFRTVSKLLDSAKDNAPFAETIYSRGDIKDISLLIAKAVVKFSSLDEAVSDAIEAMRIQVMRLLDIDDSANEAFWDSPLVSCTLYQLYCYSCNQCDDLEVCQEVLECKKCNNRFPSNTIQDILIERVNQLMRCFVLQDLKCTRCKSIKMDNLASICACTGTYENFISENEFIFNLRVLDRIARFHNFVQLDEFIKSIQFQK